MKTTNPNHTPSEERRIQYETKRAILILQHPEVLEESPTPAQPPQPSHSPLPQDSSHTRVQHFFPKGYDAHSEPFYSIVYACNHYEETKRQLEDLQQGYRELAIDHSNLKAHAQRLADACKAMDNLSSSQVLTWPEYENAVKYVQAHAREALAQWGKDKQ